MAERSHRSSDLPNFDTYPASPPVEQIDLLREREKHHTQLEQRAAELGAAAGKVVYMVRRARSSAKNLPDPVLDRLGGLAEEARLRAEHLRTTAAERGRHWVQLAREKAAEVASHAREESRKLRQQARSNYAVTRRKADEVAHDYPVHVALAAGAAGFLIGVSLRIWRSNRAH